MQPHGSLHLVPKPVHRQPVVKKAPTSIEILQINVAIREVIALTSSEANRNGVSARMRLAEDLPFIQGDRMQLQEVMLNLVTNAIDSMSAVDAGPRELTISTASGSEPTSERMPRRAVEGPMADIE
jgi:C4-dicarboxylate-specific signal transduction histidine kinase